ncbi:hypothetical protein HYW55_00800 [Candidatus Gottesmanbacteria bacterium]|nr:hypothetical protein [Candidatus Gottesmanbacteria bacterium]
MTIYHKKLASGDWKQLSFLEQMAHIGSEVIRAVNWKERNKAIADKALERALELIDLTRNTDRTVSQLRELCRVRELLIDFYFGFGNYISSKEEWEKYFYQVTYAAQLKRQK